MVRHDKLARLAHDMMSRQQEPSIFVTVIGDVERRRSRWWLGLVSGAKRRELARNTPKTWVQKGAVIAQQARSLLSLSNRSVTVLSESLVNATAVRVDLSADGKLLASVPVEGPINAGQNVSLWLNLSEV